MKKQMKYKKGGKGWMKSNPIQEAKDKKTAKRKAAGKLLAKVNKAQNANYLFATPGSLKEVDEEGNLLPEYWKKGGMRYKNGGYSGKTESSSSEKNISTGKRSSSRKKQRETVLDISSRQKGEEFTKKQKRATKRIMRKSDRIRRAEERQRKREERTGSKYGKGLLGKVREKVSGAIKKRRTKNINKQMDKLSFKQAFNVGRRYVPGKTFTHKGKEYGEKLGTSDKQKGGVKGESKIDYDKILSILGFIPGGKLPSKAKKSKYMKPPKKQKNVDKYLQPMNKQILQKKVKKQKGGFHVGSGSFIEPGIESID